MATKLTESGTKIKRQLRREKFLSFAVNLISFRPRSTKEVADYLAHRGAKSGMVRLILTKLTRLNYLDDVRFARLWVESRLRLKPKGEKLLRLELTRKGISQEIINQTLRLLNVAESELERARTLLEKKSRLWSELPVLKRKQRAFAFLSRQGFSANAIRSLVDANWQNE